MSKKRERRRAGVVKRQGERDGGEWPKLVVVCPPAGVLEPAEMVVVTSEAEMQELLAMARESGFEATLS